jgi:hypothetical protein
MEKAMNSAIRKIRKVKSEINGLRMTLESVEEHRFTEKNNERSYLKQTLKALRSDNQSFIKVKEQQEKATALL